MKRSVVLPGILLLALASGCLYEMRDEMAECQIGMANSHAAKHAWRFARGACAGLPCKHSFKEGFFAGYLAIMDGGSGCLPAIPQFAICNHMWMDCHCSDGQKTDAWYDGYEHGVMAAKAEGMADSNRMSTRIPHATPVDYSQTGRSNADLLKDDTSPDLGIPPAPMEVPTEEADPIGGPQTSR